MLESMYTNRIGIMKGLKYMSRKSISGPGHCSVSTTSDGKLLICYHIHADPANPSDKRVVRINRLTIPQPGVLQVEK